MTGTSRYAPPVADGHEQWFIDESPKNRMVLALLSGIDDEISWSLFRLGHLSYQHGSRFFLKPLFGLTDALFEWPAWYIRNDGGLSVAKDQGWSVDPNVERKRKHALESVLVLRNASFEEANARYIIGNRRTMPLLQGLETLSQQSSNAEFILYLSELFQSLSGFVVMPPVSQSQPTKVPPLQAIAILTSTSKDRSVILALLSGLSHVFSSAHPHNLSYVDSDSLAVDAAIRYLPLSTDRPLLAASLDYLYAHLSNPPAAKAFLHRSQLTNVLRMCVAILLADQDVTKKTVPLGLPIATAPVDPPLPPYQLTEAELEKLLETPEPHRCTEWLQRMYVPAGPDEFEVQGNLWALYRDTFQPHGDRVVGGLAPATDVVKRMMDVFPQTTAVLDPGPPQRYILKGIRRRYQEGVFKCRWDRGACDAPDFASAKDLVDHISSTHLEPKIAEAESAMQCEWLTCPFGGVPLDTLKSHVLTHMASPTPEKRHAGQPSSVTLPRTPFPHPSATPTQRPPPPPPAQNITYKITSTDPSSISLTALLVLRVIFRYSFPDVGDPAPPIADDTRFGFPMPPALSGEMQELAKDREDGEGDDEAKKSHGTEETEGQMKGRRAFERIGTVLASVRLKDESLAAWVEEMVGAVDQVPFSEE